MVLFYRPTAMLIDTSVNLGHEPDSFRQGRNYILIMRQFITTKHTALAGMFHLFAALYCFK
jgi:hypothetical protein